MKDEYGDLDDSGHSFILDEDFHLEAGGILSRAEVRYQTWGTLNATKDNCLVVCHALTGNQSLDTWWGECLGPGKAFDTNKYFVVCANVLGSCYGTTGPMSIDHSAPSGNKRYGSDFPAVSIRDTVRLHMRMLSEGLGVKSVESVVGGSMGGMQALEWLLLGGPEFVRSGVAIACGAQHMAWQIAISETQREAIRSNPENPQAGLSVARMIAMVSYRTADAFDLKFGRQTAAAKKKKKQTPSPSPTPPQPQPQQEQEKEKKEGEQEQEQRHPFYQVESYLRYQGLKFQGRFDAMTYICLTRLMDTHDVGRGRAGGTNTLR